MRQPPMRTQYDEYQDTPLWRALSSVLTELQATREVSVATGQDYVIGYICRELANKRVVDPAALEREAGR